MYYSSDTSLVSIWILFIRYQFLYENYSYGYASRVRDVTFVYGDRGLTPLQLHHQQKKMLCCLVKVSTHKAQGLSFILGVRPSTASSTLRCALNSNLQSNKGWCGENPAISILADMHITDPSSINTLGLLLDRKESLPR